MKRGPHGYLDFCACGRKAFKVKANSGVCERCYEFEKTEHRTNLVPKKAVLDFWDFGTCTLPFKIYE